MSTATDNDATEFRRRGYLVVRGLFERSECERMRALAESMLDPLMGPAEFEADVGYPGAPSSRVDAGGLTPRRLLHAYSRHELLREAGTDQRLGAWLRRLLDGEPMLSQAHHNCIMTKTPGYSSSTDWHRDIRYWSFERAELISSWIALGREHRDNGGLRVIPGSHTLELPDDRFDDARFLRADVPANVALMEDAADVTLDTGDVLFFHCRLFHAAGRNASTATKFSLVFSYHDRSNRPTPGSRSALYPSIPVRLS